MALVVDGISCAGKSRLLRGLQQLLLDQAPNYTKLIISEHMTERFFEGVQPSLHEVHDHVSNVLRIITQLREAQKGGPFSSNVRISSAVVERLFLTFMSRELMSRRYFDEQGELVAAAQLRHVLILIPDDLIEQRLHSSLSHRVKAWADFIASLGGVRQATNVFKSQQSRMLEENNELPSSIEKITLPVSQLSELEDQELIRKLLWPHL